MVPKEEGGWILTVLFHQNICLYRFTVYIELAGGLTFPGYS